MQKAQDEHCEYLSEDLTCLAWDRLEDIGRGNGISFYCLNTGPSVCRPMIEVGTDWRLMPEMTGVLFEAFRKLYISTFKGLMDIDPEIRDGDT